MVALTAAADDQLIVHLGACGSSGDLAVLHGVASSLKEAQSGLLGSGVLLLVAHAIGVDGVVVDVGGEGHLIAVIGNLRSGPRGIGDGVVDDVGPLAVVGVDSHVTVHGQHGGQTLTQVLGGIGGTVVAHLHVVGVDAHIAVAQVVHGVDGDDGTVEVLAAAVGCGNLLDGVSGEGRIGDVQSAGLHAVDLIGLVGLLEVDVLDLGLALPVVLVGLQSHGAVLIADELVGTSAHGLAVLLTHDGQIALGEAELVVLVVVQLLLAVVVHGSNHQRQLIDAGGGDLSGGHTHGVVTGLLDAGDVGSGLTGLNTHVVGIIVLNEVGEISQAAGRLLSGHLSGIAIVGSQHSLIEVLISGILSQAGIVIVGSDGSHAVLGLVLAVGDHILADVLGVLRTSLVHSSPQSSLLLLGPQGEVGVVAGSGQDQVELGIHAGTVLVHTHDGLTIQSGAAIIGGVGQDVHGEDHVVDVHLGAVGELDAILQGDVIVHGAVLVLGDHHIGNTGVGVVGAVVLLGLALNAVEDHSALTVRANQGLADHAHDVSIIGRGVEEGRELAVVVAVANHQGTGLVVVVAGRLVAASREQTKRHDRSHAQRKHSFRAFHVEIPP